MHQGRSCFLSNCCLKEQHLRRSWCTKSRVPLTVETLDTYSRRWRNNGAVITGVLETELQDKGPFPKHLAHRDVMPDRRDQPRTSSHTLGYIHYSETEAKIMKMFYPSQSFLPGSHSHLFTFSVHVFSFSQAISHSPTLPLFNSASSPFISVSLHPLTPFLSPSILHLPYLSFHTPYPNRAEMNDEWLREFGPLHRPAEPETETNNRAM